MTGEHLGFAQALAALRNGARGVRRVDWSNPSLFIYLNSSGRAAMGHGPDAPEAGVPALAPPSDADVTGVDLSLVDVSDAAAVVRVPNINGWYGSAGFGCWQARSEDLAASDWYIV